MHVFCCCFYFSIRLCGKEVLVPFQITTPSEDYQTILPTLKFLSGIQGPCINNLKMFEFELFLCGGPSWKV